jgi:antitoxin ParD1/3/4
MIMPTRNVVLTDHNEKMIESLVAGGRYQNASEVLRDGLRLVEEREAENAAKLAALRDAIRLGIESLERGEYEEFDDTDQLKLFMDRLAEESIADENP